MNAPGESYGELGGQLPSSDDKERGREWVRRMRAVVERADIKRACGHGMRLHGPSGACYGPVGDEMTDCPCGTESETTGEQGWQNRH